MDSNSSTRRKLFKGNSENDPKVANSIGSMVLNKPILGLSKRTPTLSTRTSTLSTRTSTLSTRTSTLATRKPTAALNKRLPTQRTRKPSQRVIVRENKQEDDDEEGDPTAFVDKLRTDYKQPSNAIPQPPQLTSPTATKDQVLNVTVRVRPIPPKEKSKSLAVKGNSIVLRAPKCSHAFRHSQGVVEERLTFDRVFDTEVSQRTVFNKTAKEMVNLLIQKKDSVLFAYGVTNSGKSYTVVGAKGSHISKSQEQGIIPRTLSKLCGAMEDLDKQGLQVWVSCLEIYNDGLKCLLSNNSSQPGAIGSPGFRKVRRHSSSAASNIAMYTAHCETKYSIVEIPQLKRMQVNGMKHARITCLEDAHYLLTKALSSRTIEKTACNDMSSRAHTVFTFSLYNPATPSSQDIPCQDDSFDLSRVVSQMVIIDMAGIERAKKTQTQAKHLRETGEINKSLLHLTKCLRALNAKISSAALSKSNFRDTKLTHLLKPFLSGYAARVNIIINVHAGESDFDEKRAMLKEISEIAHGLTIVERTNNNADKSRWTAPENTKLAKAKIRHGEGVVPYSLESKYTKGLMVLLRVFKTRQRRRVHQAFTRIHVVSVQNKYHRKPVAMKKLRRDSSIRSHATDDSEDHSSLLAYGALSPSSSCTAGSFYSSSEYDKLKGAYEKLQRKYTKMFGDVENRRHSGNGFDVSSLQATISSKQALLQEAYAKLQRENKAKFDLTREATFVKAKLAEMECDHDMLKQQVVELSKKHLVRESSLEQERMGNEELQSRLFASEKKLRAAEHQCATSKRLLGRHLQEQMLREIRSHRDAADEDEVSALVTDCPPCATEHFDLPDLDAAAQDVVDLLMNNDACEPFDQVMERAIGQVCNRARGKRRSRQVGTPNSMVKFDFLVNQQHRSSENAEEESEWSKIQRFPPKLIDLRHLPSCGICDLKFNHEHAARHCRSCGYAFCADCASKKLALPWYGYDKAVRVCDSCVGIFQE